MPLADHVDHARRQIFDKRTSGKMGSSKGRSGGRRQAISVALDESYDSVFSPILSHLPSFSGIPALKGFLPTSPTQQTNRYKVLSDDTKATWENADLGDGRGMMCEPFQFVRGMADEISPSPLLLITAKHHALQIFIVPPSTIPVDAHVPENHPAPEEVFSLPTVRYDSKTVRTPLPGITIASTNGGEIEHVLQARILEKGVLGGYSGPLVALM